MTDYRNIFPRACCGRFRAAHFGPADGGHRGPQGESAGEFVHRPLFAGGVEKIGEKIREEAEEVVEAAGEPGEQGRRHLIREAGDLIYHLLVMLGYRDVKLAEVEAEIARRFGISGIDEKAAGRNNHGVTEGTESDRHKIDVKSLNLPIVFSCTPWLRGDFQ